MSSPYPDRDALAATDDGVIDLSEEVPARRSRPNRPLVATRIDSTETTEEILAEVEQRATAAYIARRRRITSRR